MTPRELGVLFTPLTIRNLTLRNRFVMPGMQRGFMNDGAPAPKMVEYLRRCAAGGAGLVISESTSPDHPSSYWQPVMGRMDGGTLRDWKKVVDEEPSELTVEQDLRILADRVRRGTLDLVGVGRMHIANNDFVNKVREGRFSELALFSKNRHLVEVFEALEPGFQEESRRNVAAD